jgi:hypothetical protein
MHPDDDPQEGEGRDGQQRRTHEMHREGRLFGRRRAGNELPAGPKPVETQTIDTLGR